MSENLFVTGVGGQGTITLCNLIAEHASDHGFRTSFFQSRGMAHRGGRVTGEIRIAENEDESFGPRISQDGADILIGMEIAELINSYSYLKEGGIVIIVNYSYIPSEVILKKKEFPSLQQAVELFSKKTKQIYSAVEQVNPVNLFTLGLFSAVKSSFKVESDIFSCISLEKTIMNKMKRNKEENIKAFRLGYEYGKKTKEIF